jgi:hypothetical protein
MKQNFKTPLNRTGYFELIQMDITEGPHTGMDIEAIKAAKEWGLVIGGGVAFFMHKIFTPIFGPWLKNHWAKLRSDDEREAEKDVKMSDFLLDAHKKTIEKSQVALNELTKRVQELAVEKGIYMTQLKHANEQIVSLTEAALQAVDREAELISQLKQVTQALTDERAMNQRLLLKVAENSQNQS